MSHCAQRHPSVCQRLLTLLLGASLALGCRSDPELTRIVRAQRPAPGSSGHPVLWITPHPRTPFGGLSATLQATVDRLAEADPATAEGIESLAAALQSEDPRVRLVALEALGAAGTAQALLAALPAARDPHPSVQARARARLGEWADGPALFSQGIRDPEPSRQRAAAALWPVLLATLETPARNQALASALDTASDGAARLLLITTGCAAPLQDAARARADAESQAGAALCALRGMGRGAKGELPALLALLASETPETRAVAAALLGQAVDRLSPEGRQAAIGALDRAARSPDARTSIAVRTAQAFLEVKDAVSALAIWLRTEAQNPRIQALEALTQVGHRLGELRGPTLNGALQTVYDNPDELVRLLAATVAGFTRDGRVAAPLTQLATDPVAEVRRAAVYAIGRANIKLAVPVLIERAIDDPDRSVQDTAYAALHVLVHGYTMPPPDQIASFLETPGAEAKSRPFWGRDFERWRRWYQTER